MVQSGYSWRFWILVLDHYNQMSHKCRKQKKKFNYKTTHLVPTTIMYICSEKPKTTTVWRGDMQEKERGLKGILQNRFSLTLVLVVIELWKGLVLWKKLELVWTNQESVLFCRLAGKIIFSQTIYFFFICHTFLNTRDHTYTYLGNDKYKTYHTRILWWLLLRMKCYSSDVYTHT